MKNEVPMPQRTKTPLQQILALARPEARNLAVGTAFLLLGSGLGLLYPQLMRVIIDQALTDGGDKNLIDRSAGALLGIFALQALAVAVRHYLFFATGERVVARLRKDLFASLMFQEVAFFDERRTGELTNRLASDTTLLQSAVGAHLSMVLRHGVTALGGVALLLHTSPMLTVLMLTIMPAVAVGAVLVGHRVRRLTKGVQDALAASNEVAEESLSGIRTVRQFAAESAAVARYSERVDRSYELARRRSRQWAYFMAATSFAGYASAAVVLWYGGRLTVAGQLTVGELTSFLLYSLLVAFSLAALADLWAEFMRAAGAAERIFELMQRPPAMAPSGGERPASVEGRVDFQDVRFSYPARADVPVLHGLHLSLKPGEGVALVGPSGAGKSTMASLLSRLYDPTHGRILLDGRPLTALDPEWLRQQVGVVSQEPLLFSASVAENIRYGRAGATLEEVTAAARAAHADEFIARFPEGYDTRVGERGVQLSGGQKQRVAIARAMLKNPRLLVLDEATSALDAESEHLVQDALARLMRGRTTLVIAHRLSTVMGADRVVVLERGHVVQQGPHTRLLAEGGLYRRLVERQFATA